MRDTYSTATHPFPIDMGVIQLENRQFFGIPNEQIQEKKMFYGKMGVDRFIFKGGPAC